MNRREFITNLLGLWEEYSVWNSQQYPQTTGIAPSFDGFINWLYQEHIPN